MRRFEASPVFPAALSVALLALSIAMLEASHAISDFRSVKSPTFRHSAETQRAAALPSPGAAHFASALPAAYVADHQILFATKLANEQSVRVQQIQSEALKTASKQLGQHRLTLQLRGDYRDIKNIWVALLVKFPGLTLEHLTIRHHAGSAATALSPGSGLSPADRGDDEATIEMIQYLAPAKGES